MLSSSTSQGGLRRSSFNSSGDNEGMCVVESERLDQEESLVIHLSGERVLSGERYVVDPMC